MTRRLLLGLLGFAALVLALLIVPLGIANQRSERTDLTLRLERDAVAAAALAGGLLDPGTAATSDVRDAAIRDRLDAHAAETGARVVVVNPAGSSVLDTGEPGRGVELGRDFSTRPEVAAALEGSVESGERGSDTLGHQLLYVAVPVSFGGESLGAVRLSFPAEELEERITRYWLGLVAIALAVLGIASVAALLVARWIGRPLEAIAQIADDVGAGDLTVRADESDGPPEVRAVAARLNASVAAVQRTIEDQRAFTADASHQLRTPLHSLTLRLDNVVHELAAGDLEDAAADIDKAAAEVERLAALVEALLVLERADRRGELPSELIDVADVVRSREPSWTERAARVDVRIEVDVPDGLEAYAIDVHLEQVLDNYVDNALAVTPSGRSVRVIGRRVGNTVELHVVDDGPGLPDEDLEQVFRRFHSAAGRPRSAGSGGFGLGLAIVRRLAEVDGGRAELRHGSGRGIDAMVSYRGASGSGDLPALTVGTAQSDTSS
jgi:signal transduction histidine kinase